MFDLDFVVLVLIDIFSGLSIHGSQRRLVDKECLHLDQELSKDKYGMLAL